MAGIGYLTRMKESVLSLRRYSFLYKLYWMALLGGLGYLLYYDISVYQRKSGEMSRSDTTKRLERHYPHAILIGFPRCGAGAVPEHLQLHSHVGYNENLNFFHNEQRYKRGLDWYKDQVPKSAWNAIGIERSTEYIYHEKAAERIKQMNSSVRIIVGVCDPVKRAVNEYRNLMASRMANNQSYPDFDDIVLTSKGKVNKTNEWVVKGQYDDFFSMWLKYFPLKQFFFINGPDFREDPLAVLGKLERFLNLEPQLTAITLEDYRIWKAENSPPTKKIKPHADIDDATLDKLYIHYNTYNKRFFNTTHQTFDWE